MNSAEKLRLLRRRMQEQGMDAYVVVTDDFHGSEYVGDYFKAREYLSGFTGSAGTLVVLPDSAALWTDGRYFLQAADQLAGSTIDLMRAGQPGVPTIGAFLAQRVPQGGTVGFDGRTVSSLFARTMAAALEGKNVRFAYEQDLAGAVWPDRPALSAQPVWELPAECAGLTREEKLHLLREKMRETGAEVLVLTALDEVAWTLNLRGDDVRCTPVFLSFLLLRQEEATLCVQEQILSGELNLGPAAGHPGRDGGADGQRYGQLLRIAEPVRGQGAGQTQPGAADEGHEDPGRAGELPGRPHQGRCGGVPIHLLATESCGQGTHHRVQRCRQAGELPGSAAGLSGAKL